MPGTEKVLAFPVYPGVTPLDLRAEPLTTDTPLQAPRAAEPAVLSIRRRLG